MSYFSLSNTTRVFSPNSTSLPRFTAWLSAAVVAEFVATTPVLAGPATDPVHYIYRGEKRALSLDADHVAVRQKTPSGHATISSALRSRGFSEADITERPAREWMILKTKPAPGTATTGSMQSAARSASPTTGIRAQINAILSSGDPDIEFVSPVFRDQQGKSITITPRLLIGFKPDFSATDPARLLAEVPEGAVEEAAPHAPRDDRRWFMKSRDGFAVLAHANLLAETAGVAYAEPNMIMSGQLDLIPNDPSFPTSWGLQNTGQSGGLAGFDMQAVPAWNVTTGSPNIIVVVLDTGVQQDHPDINQITGKDFTPDAGSSPDGGPVGTNDDHGTWVAGCISGRINNSIGSAGIAPGVKVASARPFYNVQSNGSFSMESSSVVDALNWGQSIGARVSNISSSFGNPSSAIDAALASTRAAGMVHFASSGNGGVEGVRYPSSAPGENSIGSSTRFGTWSNFSQWGPGLKFLAPGSSIFTTDRTGSEGNNNTDYATVNGTSFASPYAAGVAALVLSQNPNFTPAQVENRMQATARDISSAGYDESSGYGLPNAFRAITGDGLPNVVPTQPGGWPNKIVFSAVAGNHTDASDPDSDDSFFVDFAVRNTGTTSTATSFSVQDVLTDAAQDVSVARVVVLEGGR